MMANNKPENNRVNQRTFKTRMTEKGLVRFEVWVKKEHIEHIKEYIKSLNDDDNDGKQ
jgi:hypothetical protein